MTAHSPALAEQLIALIRANRLLELPVSWADEIIYPAYDLNLTLRNIPHTIAQALGAPLPASQPLPAALFDDRDLTGRYDRVVVYLLDGLGYRHIRLLCEQDAGIAALVDELTGGRGPLPLTSVAPSTTAVALVTLWTGASPARTGMLGTLMRLREFWTVGNMLSFSPATGRHAPNEFVRWQSPPDQLVGAPTLSEHLISQGIAVHVVTHAPLWGTGLSQIMHRGDVQAHLHVGYTDAFAQLRSALSASRGRRTYVGIYHSGLDSLAHHYGAHNDITRAEVLHVLRNLRDVLADPGLRDGRTLFMLTADHGHYDAIDRIDVATHPLCEPLRQARFYGLTGDQRFAYLHVPAERETAVADYIHAHFGERLTCVSATTALSAGLFGRDGEHPETRFRLEGLVLIPRLNTLLEDSSVGELKLISVHAGLSDWEMFTPLLWREL